jgi:hypothetical protein
MKKECCARRAYRTSDLSLELCVSCLGNKMLAAGCRALNVDPWNEAARQLVAFGALLTRLPCGSSSALLPNDPADWEAELPPTATPHVGTIVEMVADFAVEQVRNGYGAH